MRAGQVKDVLLEDTLQGAMVCVYSEEGKTTKIKMALLDSPDDGEALQLKSRVALLNWCKPLRSRVYDLENWLIPVALNMPKSISQAKETRGIRQQIDGLAAVEVSDNQTAR